MCASSADKARRPARASTMPTASPRQDRSSHAVSNSCAACTVMFHWARTIRCTTLRRSIRRSERARIHISIPLDLRRNSMYGKEYSTQGWKSRKTQRENRILLCSFAARKLLSPEQSPVKYKRESVPWTIHGKQSTFDHLLRGVPSQVAIRILPPFEF